MTHIQSPVQQVFAFKLDDAGTSLIEQILKRTENFNAATPRQILNLIQHQDFARAAERLVPYGETYEKPKNLGNGPVPCATTIWLPVNPPGLKDVLANALANQMDYQKYGAGGVMEFLPTANPAQGMHLMAPCPGHAIVCFFGDGSNADGIGIALWQQDEEMQSAYFGKGREVSAADPMLLAQGIMHAKQLFKLNKDQLVVLNNEQLCNTCGSCSDGSGCATSYPDEILAVYTIPAASTEFKAALQEWKIYKTSLDQILDDLQSIPSAQVLQMAGETFNFQLSGDASTCKLYAAPAKGQTAVNAAAFTAQNQDGGAVLRASGKEQRLLFYTTPRRLLLVALTNDGKTPSGLHLAAWDGGESQPKFVRIAGAPMQSGTERFFFQLPDALHPFLHATKVHGDNCKTQNAPALTS